MVAHLEIGLRARVLQVLRGGAQHGAVVQVRVVPHARPARDQRVAVHARAVPERDVGADDAAGADRDVHSQARALLDDRGRVDGHAQAGLRSTTVATNSASATSLPST